MKKIIIFIVALMSALVCAPEAFCQALQLNILFDQRIDSSSFAQGEPVIILLVAGNPQARNAYYHNVAVGKDVEKVKTTTLGSKKTPWVNFIKFTVLDSTGKEVPLKFYAALAKENTVTLGAENSAQHYFCAGAEDTAKLNVGDYTIKAAYDRTMSNELQLKIGKKTESFGKESIPRLIKFGRYYYLQGDFEKAKEYAEKILALNERSLAGMHLLGDSLTGLERYQEAYDVFDKAVQEFYAQYPPKGDGHDEPPLAFLKELSDLTLKLSQ